MDALTPTKWYTPTATSGPVPCRWEGWVTFSASVGRQWIVVDHFGDGGIMLPRR